MTINRFALILPMLCLAWGTCHAAPTSLDRETIYQTSTLDALMKGHFDGDVSFRDLKRHGDFGLGTLNTLDGEVLGFDGKFYQVRSDGKVFPVPDTARTPFSLVTFFEADVRLDLTGPMEFPALEKALDAVLPSKNVFYAVRIEGTFKALKTRSVPSQKRPYPTLPDVTKTQPTFDFQNVKGTLIGFRCPEYARGVNLPGYHFHFLTADRKAGGHLLSLTLDRAKAQIDLTPGFHLALPTDKEFFSLDLTPASPEVLNQVEKGRE